MLICKRYTIAKPTIPSIIFTEEDRIVVAIIDPTATVIAKSKLDILEKLRFPVMRVKTIIAKYIPHALIEINITVSQEVLNNSFIFPVFYI
ncbi:unnamed protein product [Ectocarpus sp. 12 AP-2014]